MSTDSRQPDDFQNATTPTGQNDAGAPLTPARREESLPTKSKELPEEKRQRLEQLADNANRAHEQAKDAALRFCRHSVEAGIALLEAHDLCPKRTWGAWLAEHFDGSARTAQRYMQQAKSLLPLRGSATDLSQNHPEELTRVFASALKRLERQRAAALAQSEAPTTVGAAEPSTQPVEVVGENPPSLSSSGDPLTTVVALFDELLVALRRAIESGQWLDYGQFVLDELERIRGDLDVCRLLIRDAHLSASAPA